MGYSLELDALGVRSYLAGHPNLSRQDRVKVFAGLDSLRLYGDVYRSNIALRLSPGSLRFRFDFIFRDSSGRVRCFRFVVDDHAAAVGVLRVLYADEV